MVSPPKEPPSASAEAVEACASTLEARTTEPDAGGRAEQAADVAAPNDALQDSSVRGAMLNDRGDNLPPGSRAVEDVRGMEGERPRGPNRLVLPSDEEEPHQNNGQLCCVCVVSCYLGERTPPPSVGRSEADRADQQGDDVITATSRRQTSAAESSVGDNDDDERAAGPLAPGLVGSVLGHDENEDEGDAPVDRATTNYELPYFLPRTTRRVPNIWYTETRRTPTPDDVSLGGGDGGGARGTRSTRGSGGT
ncbi:hypothetical protein THAOC_22017 [Thalassiosira oceanica]|uniref:Uncharacterized protein n=1 Tax=Thalassiosira oceanica TaxID=159749 RepID=K0RZH0_THAOC|nr:hypothetical protein THAOC_22017 [Thalassiosira oceanica]|eukprot:EJK57899.1 hypothetical protein THAOC_22017 [Thalassiosira oceanica]